jgi:hypothetical protein
MCYLPDRVNTPAPFIGLLRPPALLCTPHPVLVLATGPGYVSPAMRTLPVPCANTSKRQQVRWRNLVRDLPCLAAQLERTRPAVHAVLVCGPGSLPAL